MENTTVIPIIMYNFASKSNRVMNHGRNTGGKDAGRPTLD